MALTEEKKQQYQECRLKKAQADRNFRRIFWGYIAVAGAFILMTLIAGALSSRTGNHHTAMIFYYSFESGMIEFICAIVTIVLAMFAESKRRTPSLILLAFFALILLCALLPKPETVIRANVVPALCGIALNIWQQLQFNQLEWLETQEGYPLFSEASHPAHFETMYHVKAAQPADSDMDAVGGTAYAKKQQHTAALSHEATEEMYGFSDLNGSQSAPHLASEKTLQSAGDVALSGFAESAAAGRPAEAAPAAGSDILLSDMSAEGSTVHKNYAPDADALPTPEEVRARLAAMKQAMQGQNPPQQ